MAASPFLNGSEPSRIALVQALKGRTAFWKECIFYLPACGQRLMSRIFAWDGPGPVQNLLEASASAMAFTPSDHDIAAMIIAGDEQCQRSVESIRLWAMVTMLSILSKPGLARSIAKFHDYSRVVRHQQKVMEGMQALETILSHPEFPMLVLQGGFEGSWEHRWHDSYENQRALIEFMDRIRASNIAAVLRREAGLHFVNPSDRFAGWWHLGKAFQRAATTFIAIMYGYGQSKYRLPLELALRTLSIAAN